ncbi:MAG: hypothetical protein V3U65_06955 [Granulosicoccaceae bacterium]
MTAKLMPLAATNISRPMAYNIMYSDRGLSKRTIKADMVSEIAGALNTIIYD